MLSPDRLARYLAAIDVVPQIERGEGKTAELPQWFADRFGWQRLVTDVEGVVDELKSPSGDVSLTHRSGTAS